MGYAGVMCALGEYMDDFSEAVTIRGVNGLQQASKSSDYKMYVDFQGMNEHIFICMNKNNERNNMQHT